MYQIGGSYFQINVFQPLSAIIVMAACTRDSDITSDMKIWEIP